MQVLARVVLKLEYLPNLKRQLHCPSSGKDYMREVGMGVWKRTRVFNWELIFWISSLIFAFMALAALLAYQSFVRSQ